MFETTAVESRKRRRSGLGYGLFLVSLTIHVLAVVATIAATIMTVSFPVSTPSVLVSFQLIEPLPSPPPPPPPPKRVAPRPKPVPKPVPVEIPPDLENLAPTVIPDEIPDLLADAIESAWEESYDVGLTGGLVGGAVGGVVGSVLGDVPPLPPDPSKGPLRVGGDVKSPIVTDAPAPEYPEKARNQRLDGRVSVECIIDKRGRVQNIRVLHSSYEMFEVAALEAVRQWKFRPGTLFGKPIDTIFKLHVNFQITRRGKKRG